MAAGRAIPLSKQRLVAPQTAKPLWRIQQPTGATQVKDHGDGLPRNDFASDEELSSIHFGLPFPLVIIVSAIFAID
jgi:hypothetical protein